MESTPLPVKHHLMDRLKERAISVSDMQALQE